MKKSVGILTYHRAHNYGAVMQAYALKKHIESQNYDVQMIDYWPAYRDENYNIINYGALKNEKNIARAISIFLKSIARAAIRFPKNIYRHNKFKRFIIKQFKTSNSSRILHPKNISGNHDAYIYGSDQIWRYNNTSTFKGFDPVYWGKYPDTCARKISYAASMGIIINGENEYISKHLNNFNNISVREENLKNFISPLSTSPISHVLDPAFLLSKDEWLKIKSPNLALPQKYILLYNLNYSKSARSLAEKIAKRYNLKIVELRGTATPFYSRQSDVYSDLGPEEFIYAFSEADYIVSTSFHGVVFSIIFEKQFISTGLKNNSDRVTGLLKLFGIENRYIQAGLENLEVTDEIDYFKLNKIKDAKVSESISFLKNSLKFS